MQTLYELDQNVINTFGVLGQTVINQNFVSLIVIRAAITFKNIRFEGIVGYIINVDDFIESTEKITSLQAYKLETKQFNLVNVDIKLTCNIMISTHPLNFLAQNIKIIDFYNIYSGFLFRTEWNYAGASLAGSIIFDSLSFEYVSPKQYKFKTGQFIDIWAPANVTISNSNFSLQYDAIENYDIFSFEDNGVCPTNDSVKQYTNIVNNSFSFYGDYSGGFNNIKVSYNDANKRYQEILISNNTFSNLYGISKPLIDVEYFSSGKIIVSNNHVYNCSSSYYLFTLQANENIEVNSNMFDSWIISSSGLISTDISQVVSINNLTIYHIQKATSSSRSSLLKLSGAQDGVLTIDSSKFYLNEVLSTMIGNIVNKIL